MPVLNHAVLISSKDNTPNPTGTPINGEQPNPTPDNPWICPYPCTAIGHTDTIDLLWDGVSFSLTETEANDPRLGRIDFTYDPPLTQE